MAAFLPNEATAEAPFWGLPLDDEKEAEGSEEPPQLNVVRRLVSLSALQQAAPERARELVTGSQALCSQSVDGSLLLQDNKVSIGSTPFQPKEDQLQKSGCGCLPIAEVAASKPVQEARTSIDEAATKEVAGGGAKKVPPEVGGGVARPLPQQRRAEIPAPLVLQKTGLRVALAANGSVGDVLPILSLALQLMQFHHTVCMFTSVNLVPLCRENGVKAEPIFADSMAVISKLGGMVADLNEGLDLSVKAAKSWMEENPKACVPAEEAFEDFRPEAIVTGPAALTVSLIHEHNRVVPAIVTFLSSKAVDEFKSYCMLKPKRPSFFACNSFLTERPPPVLPGLQHTPEWVVYRMPSEISLRGGGPFAALQQFLQDGPPPVAFGWGSMIACGLQPVDMLGLVLRALRRTEHRGVVLGGWAELDRLGDELVSGSLDGLGQDGPELAAFAAKRLCFVREAPHEWLFPQCSLVVHHGGVGTTHAVLRAGKPAVITPVFADQFKHAALIERLGAGVGFQRLMGELTADDLAHAIRAVEAKAARADSFGQKMRMQTGERDAAAFVDKFLRKEVQTGAWAKSALELKGRGKGRATGGAVGRR